MSDFDNFDDLDNGNKFDAAAASGFAPPPSAGLFDLSDIKADASGNPAPLPNGIYNCIVDDVTYGASKNSGSLMLTWKFKVVNGEFASRTIMDWTILIDKTGKRDPRGLAKLKAYLQIVAPDYDMSKFDPQVFADERTAVNAMCALKLKITGKPGDQRNNVIDVIEYNEATAMANDIGIDDSLDIL